MKKLFINLLAVLLTGLFAVGSAFAQVVAPQIVARDGYANGSPQLAHTTAAFDSTGTSTLVIFVSTHQQWDNGNGFQPVNITGISDSAGNTWKKLVGPAVYSHSAPGEPLLSEVFYVQAPVTSATYTVSVTLSNPAPLVMHIFAVGNSDTCSTPVFSPITDPGGTSTNDVASNDINSPANSLLLAWVKNEPFAIATAQDSWTLDSTSVSFLWAEYMTVAAAGAYHSHFAYDTASGWQTAIVGVLSVVLPRRRRTCRSTLTSTPPCRSLSRRARLVAPR